LQHEAVEILKKVNRLIEAQQQQASYLDELVKSRFIELFGDPVSNPKRWSVCALEECLVSIENGKSFVCSNEARQGILPAVLKLSAATYGEYHPEENKAVLDAEMFVTSAEVHAGDLLFTRKNTPELVGMCTYVWETPPALMMPDLIFRLNTNSKCRKIYLWKLINHDSFRSQIQAIAGGSAKSMSNISKERLGRLPIMLPPISIQDQFATFVEQVDKSKLAVQKGLEELEILKKSLMQQYFG
jgi:type I restriction enzyme S subunit